mgnify:FL=1
MGKQSWKPGNMLNPVPAVMVSVADEAHRPNIITVAWAGTICTNPPMVSISVRPSRYSYDIIEKTGEFVINLTTEKLARACDYCGVVSGRDVDKFAKTGLTPMPVEHVSAPAIAEKSGQHRLPRDREPRTRQPYHVHRRGGRRDG